MRKIFILSFILFSISRSFAQYLEIGAAAGLSFYSGDISHGLGGTLSETRGAFGAFVRKNFSERTALKVNFNYAKIGGRDKYAREEDLKDRNISFQTTVMELGANFEYNIKDYMPDGMYSTYAPYLFIGVAGLKYDPKTRYENKWVDLRPLQTEGQNYANFSVALPLGGGVKYALNDHWNLGAELGLRPTFTDYLDDVSGNYLSRSQLLASGGITAADLGNKIDAAAGVKRGNDSKIDWYHFLQFTISYNFIDNGLIGSRRALRGRKGCKQSLF